MEMTGDVICGGPSFVVGVECRVAGNENITHRDVPDQVFRVPCTVDGGLVCKKGDKEQPGGLCKDYEVRFMCRNGWCYIIK